MFEARAVALQEEEAAASDLRGAVLVDDLQVRAQFVVGGHGVGVDPQVLEALAVDLLVVALVLAGRNVLLGDVRNLKQRGLQFRFEFVGALFDRLQFLLELLRAVDGLLGRLVFSVLFELADLAGDLVSLVSEVVPFRLEFAPLLVDLQDRVEVDVGRPPEFEGLPHRLGVIPEVLAWYHARRFCSGRENRSGTASARHTRSWPSRCALTSRRVGRGGSRRTP